MPLQSAAFQRVLAAAFREAMQGGDRIDRIELAHVPVEEPQDGLCVPRRDDLPVEVDRAPSARGRGARALVLAPLDRAAEASMSSLREPSGPRRAHSDRPLNHQAAAAQVALCPHRASA